MSIRTTISESHMDLLGTDVAMLATLGPDGHPQVTATWFVLDDDGLVKISLNTERQKVKNLYNNAMCTFFILDLFNVLRTLEIRAHASITPDPDYVLADKYRLKYGLTLRQMDAPGQTRVVVTLHPDQINAIDLSRES
jgi:PPOX class probable F420-dependent enzyme